MLKPTRLVSEDGVNLSVGRLTFWFVLGLATYFWLFKPIGEFPPSLTEMLYISTGYNIVKKGLNRFGGGVNNVRNNSEVGT